MEVPNNNKILDHWTLQHILWGFVVGSVVRKRELGYGIIIGYEIIENILMRTELGHLFQETEGWVNAISDTIVGLISYELGKKYGER